MSNRLRAIPYKHGHLDLMEIRGNQLPRQEITRKIESGIETKEIVARTVLLDGKPVAIVGLTLLWTGVAEAWSLLSHDIQIKPVSFHKTVQTLLKEMEDIHQLFRVQATVRSDYRTGIRWLMGLGFELEALMKKYGPEHEDHFLYARVR
jgi:hypothetical protein